MVNVLSTPSCLAQAKALGAPLAGTAVERTAVWIVLEHRGPWRAKAVAEGDFGAGEKERLLGFAEQIEGSRVQLVRQPGRRSGALGFWVAVTDVGGCRAFRWALPNTAALLDIDVPAAVAAIRRGEAIEEAQPVERPMVLVCTNGRRDVCCSIEGIPVAHALAEQPGIDVWHTTHLGGHRFAATLLTLPDGLCYGFVERGDAAGLATAIAAGRVYSLDKLRGRTALSKPEQAAETAWRRATQTVDVEGLVAAECERDGDLARVTLTDAAGGQHPLRMELQALGATISTSCGKEPEPVSAWRPRTP